MVPWLLIAGMSTVLLYHFNVIGGLSDDGQIERAYNQALAHETDALVLTTFAYKLIAAGYQDRGNQLLSKARLVKNETIERRVPVQMLPVSR